MGDVSVRRVDFGFFLRPAEETGTGAARVDPCLGYLVDHPEGRLLFDTGMGRHPDTDAHYRPRLTPLAQALATAGGGIDGVTLVVNCHLHFDHCGGNPQLTGRPILVQRAELAAVHQPGYTLPDLVDAPGLQYEELAGEAEPLPGVTVLPTPGHTAGHQSLLVRRGDGTLVVLAGQTHDTATGFSSDALTVRAGGPPGVQPPPEWLPALLDRDPRRVVFAHDHAVWEP